MLCAAMSLTLQQHPYRPSPRDDAAAQAS